MKTLILILAAILGLAGCQNGTLPDTGTQVAVAKLAVTYAVVKYCEKAGDPAAQAARCARVKTIASDAEALATGNTEVTIALLDAAIQAKLPADLTPTDRALALGLIQLVEQELQARVGGQMLKPEQLVVVRQVIGWVVEATAYVGAPPPA